MIACPICGSKTTVRETRMSGMGLRRRRHCSVIRCTGRVTTFEVIVQISKGSSVLADGNFVLVPAQQLARLREIVALLGACDNDDMVDDGGCL